MCIDISGLMVRYLGLRAYSKYHVSWEIQKNPKYPNTIRCRRPAPTSIPNHQMKIPGIICCLRGGPLAYIFLILATHPQSFSCNTAYWPLKLGSNSEEC